MSKHSVGNTAIFRKMIVGSCIVIFLLPYSGKITGIIVGIVLGLAVLALKLVGIEREDAGRSQEL
ncbi:hypothetical protein ACO0LL_21300 [Undibacterium sp. TC4M20W]|uniref:hypothetical protein n=1 Tax=Undibacterium sp. TC4M20W TaxID=3413052 RepID=UPI003BF17299